MALKNGLITTAVNLLKQNEMIMRKHVRRMCQCQEDVILDSTKTVGILMLNRPQYLNALNVSMLNKILAGLNNWSKSKALIIIRALGGQALSAGADMRKIAEAAYIGDYAYGDEFFYRQYLMNLCIGCFRTPIISFMDGITMGSGLGLCIHSKYRVATENTLCALPECRVGFFPDAGCSYWLSRELKGLTGLYLALTGQRLKGGCVYHAGIASHYIESRHLPSLERELMLCSGHADVQDVLDCFHKTPNPHAYILKAHQGSIDSVFMELTAEDMMNRLELMRDISEWARCVIKTLRSQCPTTLKATINAYHKGHTLNLRQCLNMELQMAKYAIRQPDFYEGVRAQIISKDNNPQFNPSKLEDVTDELVEPFFEDCTCTRYSRL